MISNWILPFSVFLSIKFSCSSATDSSSSFLRTMPFPLHPLQRHGSRNHPVWSKRPQDLLLQPCHQQQHWCLADSLHLIIKYLHLPKDWGTLRLFSYSITELARPAPRVSGQHPALTNSPPLPAWTAARRAPGRHGTKQAASLLPPTTFQHQGASSQPCSTPRRRDKSERLSNELQ